jgi:hypothetical protein
VIEPGNAIWICPGNARRCNASALTNNLFHYCLNENVNGTGANDNRRMRFSAVPKPSACISVSSTSGERNGRRPVPGRPPRPFTTLRHRRCTGSRRSHGSMRSLCCR